MDAVIIGGGASGIACAIRLKQQFPECNVTVLEHLEEPCKKLHATGNGRCNITNTAADGYDTTKAFFESIGLVLRESHEGRMYPYSNQAVSVVSVLKSACDRYHINIIGDCNVYKTDKMGERFHIFSTKGVFVSDILVIATGGQSQPSLGSDGSGYALVKSLGHTVTDLSPALVQLSSSSRYCRHLKGVRTKCILTIEKNGQAEAAEYGELLFADYGLSGIVTMDLSHFISDEKLQSGEDRCVAVIDFVPDMTSEDLTRHFEAFGSLEGILPSKLYNILSKQANNEPEKIIQYAKTWRLIITGTKGYRYAQITKGGVPREELTANNESTVQPRLYIIGELTDNQFRCGGFNLDYAFSSGVRAADDIAAKYAAEQ